MPDIPGKLYIVRAKEEDRYWNGRPVQSNAPFRLEGIFTTRRQPVAGEGQHLAGRHVE